MGQWKFTINLVFQIGLLIKLEPNYELIIDVFCLSFYFGLTKHAQGIEIFGKRIK